MAPDPLHSTYGVWLVSLGLGSILYGIGLLQTWLYFHGRSSDTAFISYSVLLVLLVETAQIVFFFRSSYSRFVDLFGVIQLELIWVDALQLATSYVGAFIVQVFFATRIYIITKGQGLGRFSLANVGVHTIFVLSVTSLLAGIAQTVWSTNNMMDRLLFEAINRGTLTALASVVNLILFLALPGTFWFIGLAPSSKLYMNSMLATLNTRQRIREQIASVDKGCWNSIPIGTVSAVTSKASSNKIPVPPFPPPPHPHVLHVPLNISVSSSGRIKCGAAGGAFGEHEDRAWSCTAGATHELPVRRGCTDDDSDQGAVRGAAQAEARVRTNSSGFPRARRMPKTPQLPERRDRQTRGVIVSRPRGCAVQAQGQPDYTGRVVRRGRGLVEYKHWCAAHF
ncbi:hypothetical protein GGX14DRAFT_647476 [Mycena pura]|uniref:DUF6534 domain-containing protein n=1 Tax=Mycena pura TaxID=153505 RepID=A0AAD6V6M9_9AGAR|nr:hypothetical protein GGX14DRAFT_647476 [Mycena pura]